MEKYSVKKAQNEASRITDTIKEGKARDYDSAEKIVDRENLSAESYVPFRELFPEETFSMMSDKYAVDRDRYIEDFGEDFEKMNPNLETAIDIITCMAGKEPWLKTEYKKSFSSDVDGINDSIPRRFKENKYSDGSPNKFCIGDKVISLNLSTEYLSALKAYAREMGKVIINARDVSPSESGRRAGYGSRDDLRSKRITEVGRKCNSFLTKYITLEAVAPFLNENIQFEYKSQPYFEQVREYIEKFRDDLRETAKFGLKYIIVNRNLLGANREQVLNSAVNGMFELAGGNVFGYTNPWHDEGGYSRYLIGFCRHTLKKLIEEDPSFDWINDRTSQFDDERNKYFKDLLKNQELVTAYRTSLLAVDDISAGF